MESATASGASTGNGAGAAGAPIEVENPASGETIATVPALGAAEVAALAAAARAAQPGWQALGFEGRARVLMAARAWLVTNAERVVETICGETGRPADEVQFTDMGYGISALEFWAANAERMLADEDVETASPSVRGGRKLKLRYAPVGLVGVIGPWNFPLTNSFGDCIPALAAGNAVILKPSEVTPLTSLLMAEMLTAAGIPDGVFAVATGRGEAGAALVEEADFVMFTGSTATGKKVMAKAAETLTPVSLELGGKDPMIVLADADIERAANSAATFGLLNAGQVCISVERIYVEDSVHDEFVARLTEKVSALRQGPPGELGSVDVGAIIFPPQIETIEAHVADAVEHGAEVVLGGHRAEGLGPGRFYEPTVLTGVDHSMRCMREETFGPTLPVMRVADEEQAISLANEGGYGLQASVWTGDVAHGEELARRLEAGVASVNDTAVNYNALELPMGGWKESGLGSRHGADGIRKYTKRQSILVTPAWAPSREAFMFPYDGTVSQTLGEAMAALALSEIFSPAQRLTLAAFCDTLIPSLDAPAELNGSGDPLGFWARSAADMAIAEAIEIGLLQADLSAEEIEGLRGLLDALAEQGMAAATPLEAREAIIHGFSDSSPEALGGVATLKGLALSLYYALPDAGTGINPNWPAMGYPGPQALPKPGPKPLKPLPPPADEAVTLEADVVVVGSGAGGGVIAGELAKAGHKVIVTEMGGYFDESDFLGLELTAYQQLFLNGGPFTTAEGQVGLQAGSSLGGGTVLNWTNCLRTTDWVRSEWANEYGLEGIDGSDYDAHLDAVWERISVNDRCSDLNGPHQRLKEGVEARGGHFELITRNTDPETYDPVTAGYLGFGEQSGSKRSTQKTYLVDAADNGAEILIGCRIERVLTEGGRGVGVEGQWAREDGTTVAVTVRAKAVVVAGGSIESPALLQRSGIGGPAAGDYLRLHPAVAIYGVYEEDQDPWWGPPQAGLSHSWTDRAGDGYGFLLECGQHTTGLYGAAVPWQSGAQHKAEMLKLRRNATFIGIDRDRGHGRVDVDARGRAVPSYLLSDEADIAIIRDSLEEMVHLQEAAGALEIGALSRKPLAWKRGEDLDAYARDRSQRVAGPARDRRLQRPPDGQLPDGQRPGDQRRRPVGRAARHRWRLDRRCERLPDGVGDEPDADGDGARPAHLAGD